MKEIHSIINAYSQIDFTTTSAALATVVGVEGSSYRRMGARMLVLEDGSVRGGISGGCLEGDARRRAQKAMQDQKASIHTYDTTRDDEHQVGVGLGCNGIIDVLLTPLNGHYDVVTHLKEMVSKRSPTLMITSLSDSEYWKKGDTKIFDSKFDETSVPLYLRDAFLSTAQQCIHDRSSCKKELDKDCIFFFELLMPATQLILCGGNYDLFPLARISKELGWETKIVCNKSRASHEMFQLASIYDQRGNELPAIDEFTAVILMSHDLKTDTENLQRLIGSNARYIAILGPAKRREKIYFSLREAGYDLDKLQDKLHAPAGLDIGATTPEEIAISIVSEIIAFFHNRPGTFLRNRQGAIHSSE